MRMSERDRLMAIARKPDYIKDYKKISNNFDEIIKEFEENKKLSRTQ